MPRQTCCDPFRSRNVRQNRSIGCRNAEAPGSRVVLTAPSMDPPSGLLGNIVKDRNRLLVVLSTIAATRRRNALRGAPSTSSALSDGRHRNEGRCCTKLSQCGHECRQVQGGTLRPSRSLRRAATADLIAASLLLDLVLSASLSTRAPTLPSSEIF